MDRHVTRWHQMVSRDSFGSEILISCQPLEERSNRLALLGQDWHIGVSGCWNTRLSGAYLKDSLKGISIFGRKAIVLAGLIGFEKGSQSNAGAAAEDVPTVGYDYVGCPAGHRVDCTFVPRGFHILGRRCSTVRFYGACLG